MLALKILKKNAERAKQTLIAQNALATGFKPARDARFVYFPASKKIPLPFPHSYAQKKFVEEEKAGSLKKALERKLSKKELARVVSSYDVVGDIAVIEVPRALEKKKKTIARALMQSNPRLKTVLRKAGGRVGEFRIQQVKWLAGERKTLTTHKESGCFFKIDLARVHFSPRLSTERERIANQVKPGERVLALFAGAGPYPIIIAKKQPSAEIVAIELNPIAVSLMKENVLLNSSMQQMRVIEGDVARVVPRDFAGWADRVLMPLPLKSKNFLAPVLKAARKGCIVHYYALSEKKGDVFKKPLQEISAACSKQRKKSVVLFKRIVRGYSPRLNQVAIDFMVA